MYEAQTKAALLQRMLDASPVDIDKRQGAPTYDLLSPPAIELAQAYVELDNVLNFGFADTAYGSYLDMRAAERGLTRKPAVKASGNLTFSGPNGTLIPKGTEVSTGGETPAYFSTNVDVTITTGSVTVVATAETAGAGGNVTIAAIKLVIGSLAGIVTVTNAAPFTGGVDTESDDDFRARYLDHVRKPATSGNANQYRQWALEVIGISDAKVFPVWSGPGTVKVVLLSVDKTAPTAGKVAEVAAYIEAVRPIGATVTVTAATEVTISLSGTYSLAAGSTLADARAQIAAGLKTYLQTLAFADPIVRYTQIANIVLNTTAVVDYSGLTVNGGTSNITIADGSVAVVGTVT